MATQELRASLLGKGKAKPTLIVSVVNILVHASIVVIAFLLIKDDPKCDQPLATWVQCVIAISIAGIVVELLKMTMGASTLTGSAMIVLGVCVIVLWGSGHWYLYQSVACDDALWYFTFILILLADVAVCLAIVKVCGLVLCAGSLRRNSA